MSDLVKKKLVLRKLPAPGITKEVDQEEDDWNEESTPQAPKKIRRTSLLSKKMPELKKPSAKRLQNFSQAPDFVKQSTEGTISNEASSFPESPLQEKEIPHFSLTVLTEMEDLKRTDKTKIPVIEALKARLTRFKPAYHCWTVAKWKHFFFEEVGLTPFWCLDDGSISLLMFARDYLTCFGEMTPPQTAAQSIRAQNVVELKSWGMDLQTPKGPVTVQITSEESPFPESSKGSIPFPTHTGGDQEPEDDGFGFVDNSKSSVQALRPFEEEKVPEKTVIRKELDNQHIENTGGVVASPEVLKEQAAKVEEIRKLAGDPMKQKWAIAESVARKSAVEIDDAIKDDYELQAMVGYIRYWVANAGEVPGYPENLVHIFLPPRVYDESNPVVVERRNEVRKKIKNYLSELWNHNHVGYDKDTTSYRKVVAKDQMENAIETFAAAAPDPENDKKLFVAIGNAAYAFYQSQFPLVTDKVGPIEDLDPDYIKYRGLCRKWNIEPGTLLHLTDIQQS